MTLTNFVEIAVQQGIASVKSANYSEERKRGAILGFKKCRHLGSIEQFQAELERCGVLERELRFDLKASKEDYWSQRFFTLQVEHVYKLLCAAAYLNKWPGHEKLPAPYVSSLRQYGNIVGVNGVQT